VFRRRFDMARRDRREEAFRAGLENPLMGDIGPMQRLYGTVQAIGEELGGADMGTPAGARFSARQKATKAEVKRLQDLRAAHPEEFGRGMMVAQEQMDPYMLGLGTGSMGAMVPRGATSFAPVREMPVGSGLLEGPAPARALPSPAPRMLGGPQGMAEAVPVAPYYRNVPPEMGTSMRPMTPFQQNQVGLSTGRFGMQGYAPEMAVTDFETYAPSGMGRTTSGPTPISKFDQNMLDAYRRGRMGTGASRGMYGEYTPEEMGSAVAPYRQGGLVYEPVGAQGAGAGRLGGQQGRPGIGYERGPIEGQWSEVYGLQGPQGRPGYGGGMDFGVTREGMAVPPSGMGFDPRMAAAAIGGGLGYMAGRGGERQQSQRYELPVMDIYGRQAPTGLSGQAPSAGSVFEQPAMQAPIASVSREAAPRKGEKGAPQPPRRPEDLKVEAPFDPNLNYLVTQALDRLFGGQEAERGRQFQRYYESQGYY
jgi:hypothetical protein